jgi:hypothetical protein
MNSRKTNFGVWFLGVNGEVRGSGDRGILCGSGLVADLACGGGGQPML